MDETCSMSDPANACTRASAEKGAEYRSRSNTLAGRKLLLKCE